MTPAQANHLSVAAELPVSAPGADVHRREILGIPIAMLDYERAMLRMDSGASPDSTDRGQRAFIKAWGRQSNPRWSPDGSKAWGSDSSFRFSRSTM